KTAPKSSNGLPLAYRCTKSGAKGENEPAWRKTVAKKIARTWEAHMVVHVDDYVRPTVLAAADPKIYKVAGIKMQAGDAKPIAVSYAKTSREEPAFDTLAESYNAGTKDKPKIITITYAADQDELSTWVRDGTCIWTCIGEAAVWSDCNQVVERPELEAKDDDEYTLAIYPIPNDATTSYYVRVTAFQKDGPDAPDGAEFELKAVYLRSGDGAPEIVKPTRVVDSNPNKKGPEWSAVLDLSENGVRVRIHGDNGKTIIWRASRME